MTTPVIAQYFYIQDENARTWDVKFRNDIPYTRLTRLYIAFGWLKNGRLTYGDTSNPDAATRVKALTAACRATNPAAEVFISSGYDDGTMYKEAANNPTAFANSVVEFLRDNNLDGYDMDWENGLDMQAMNSLLKATRVALDAASKIDQRRYHLTFATWPFVQSAYDIKAMAETLDAINVMSYGRLRDLGSIVDEYTNAGFPANKIIGGIDTEVGYREEGGEDTLGPDGTIAQKAAYARNNGLAGMMSWRLDNDYVENGISTYQGALQLYASMTE